MYTNINSGGVLISRFTQFLESFNAEPDTSIERLMGLVGRWRQSQIGNAVIDYIEQDIKDFRFDSYIESGGLYYSEYDAILITPFLSDDMTMRFFPHEARHDWQKENGLLDYEGLSFDDHVLLTRITEADAHSYTVAVCILHAAETGDDSPLQALKKNMRYAHLVKKWEKSDDPALNTPANLRRFLFDAFFDSKNIAVLEYDSYARKGYMNKKDKTVTRTLDIELLNKVGDMGDMGLPKGNFITDVESPSLSDAKYRRGLPSDKKKHQFRPKKRRGLFT